MSHATRTRDLRRDRVRPRAFPDADGCDSSLRVHLTEAGPRPAVAHFGLIVGG